MSKRRRNNIRKFAKLGIRILPVVPNGKAPFISGGVHSATNDWPVLRDHFAMHANSNYGVATGGKSGIFVVDIDGQEGNQSWRDLRALHDDLPKTVTVRTPRGRHYYFSASVTRIKNSASKLGPGIDVRGDGGYVVGPGSRHATGRLYKFVDGLGIDDVEIAKAPRWLLDLVEGDEPQAPPPGILVPVRHHSRARRYGEAALRHELDILARAQMHHRNDALNRSSFRLGQLLPYALFNTDKVKAELRRVALSLGLEESEVTPTIDSGMSAGGRSPRQLPFLGTIKLEAPSAQTADNEDLTKRLSELGETDTDNAQRLAERFGQRLMHTRARGWLTYDGKRWQRDSVAKCIELAKEAARKIGDEVQFLQDAKQKAARSQFAKASLSKGALDRMLDLCKGLVEVNDEALDAQPLLLNVSNGTFDLRTGELNSHDPGDYLTKIAPVEADPEAKCENFKKLLRRVTGDDKKFMRYLRLAVGYCLTGDTREQIFFFVYGKSGNGKSTFVNTIRNLLGDYGIHTPTETLMVKQFENSISNDIARLDGARMITAVESNFGKQLDEAKIKSMTGGEKITARFMRKEFFEFAPTGKIWLVANDRPRVRGTDMALWRRIRVLPFNALISGAADEVKDFAAMLEAERPGILAWAVRGCLAWQKEGLTAPPSIRSAGREWAKEADHVKRFVNDALITDGNSTVRSSSMFEHYQSWCAKNGESSLPLKGLKSRLTTAHNFTHTKTKRGSEWRGVKIRL